MIRVSFKANIDFDEETWNKFKSQWTMPEALLHSTIKTTLMEGLRTKYGIAPSTVGIFPPDQKTKVEPEVIGGK